MLILFPALLTNCGHTRCLSHVGTEGIWWIKYYHQGKPVHETE